MQRRSLILASQPDEPAGDDDRYKTREQAHADVAEQLDHDLIDAAAPALEEGRRVDLASDISNVDRAVGAMLSNRISTEYGGAGLPDDTISIDFEGYVWAVASGSTVSKIDPETGQFWTYNGLVGAYTYSDMTGYALSNVGTPSG